MTPVERPKIIQVGSVIAFIYIRETAICSQDDTKYKSWEDVKKDFVQEDTEAQKWENDVFVGALEIVRM